MEGHDPRQTSFKECARDLCGVSSSMLFSDFGLLFFILLQLSLDLLGWDAQSDEMR